MSNLQYKSRGRMFAMMAAAVVLSGPAGTAQTRDSDLPSAPSPQATSSSQKPAPTASEQQQPEQDLKQEEKQRILGIMPEFLTVSDRNTPPLSARQKFHLSFLTALDPFMFGLAGLDAGVSQAQNAFPGYGQGLEGYGKRLGASYADTFDGYLWGGAILPVWLHEDPRYFRKGHGPFLSRLLYAAASTLWCRRDNRSWGPNYAYVSGNLIAGGISNAYYAASDRGVGLTVDRAATVIAEGSITSEFAEFWPDLQRHLPGRRKHPAGTP